MNYGSEIEVGDGATKYPLLRHKRDPRDRMPKIFSTKAAARIRDWLVRLKWISTVSRPCILKSLSPNQVPLARQTNRQRAARVGQRCSQAVDSRPSTTTIPSSPTECSILLKASSCDRDRMGTSDRLPAVFSSLSVQVSRVYTGRVRQILDLSMRKARC